MIKSVRGTATRQFIETGKSKFSGLNEAVARRRYMALARAKRLDDLTLLSSVSLHKLKGDRRGFWAMTINGPWRLVFRFDKGDAYDVEIVDYHRG